MGLADGRAESVDALWAMRGWRAAPICMKKHLGVLGWWYQPCCSCRRDSGTFGTVVSFIPLLENHLIFSQ